MASSERKMTSNITEKPVNRAENGLNAVLEDGKTSTILFDALATETKILVTESMYVWYAWFRFFSGCRIPVPKIINYELLFPPLDRTYLRVKKLHLGVGDSKLQLLAVYKKDPFIFSGSNNFSG
jgi:hypothetical protein